MKNQLWLIEPDKKIKTVTNEGLPYWQQPKNDNEILQNMQFEFYGGNEKKLTEIWLKLVDIAEKLVRVEAKKKKLKFATDYYTEVAQDAATYVIEQIKVNNLQIKTSFIAYLYLNVKKALYGKQTKASRFEAWCIRENINIFDKTQAEKEELKRVSTALSKPGKNCHPCPSHKSLKHSFSALASLPAGLDLGSLQ